MQAVWYEISSDLWSAVCDAERNVLDNVTSSDKKKLKLDYIKARTIFDREVQMSKTPSLTGILCRVNF